MTTVKRDDRDLYAVLGIRPTASAAEVRRAYDWVTTTRQSVERRNAVRAAYAVLGDPRLRAEYDAGRVVGLGAGVYHQRGLARSHSTASTFESRWQRRQAQRPHCPPSRHGVLTALSVSLVLAAAAAGAQQWWRTTTHPVAVITTTAHPRPYTPPYVEGSCLSGAGNLIDPATRRPCTEPHQLEVVRVLNLQRLLGRPATHADTNAADEACAQEFRAFTGLAGPLPDLWPMAVTDVTHSASYATCFVASRYPRTTSSRHIAG